MESFVAEMPDLCLHLLGFGEVDFVAASLSSCANQVGFDSVAAVVAATRGIAAAVAIAETLETVVPAPSYSVAIASTALVLAATVETVQRSPHLMCSTTLAPVPLVISEDEEVRTLGIPTFSVYC